MPDEEEEQNEENREEPTSSSFQEDTGSSCTICMEEWTIGGPHRVCCLKCGHIFGRSCIERWIKEKGSNSKCPNCNKAARKLDLRDLWCKSIRATDNSELIQLNRSLEDERKLRRTDSTTIFRQNLELEHLRTQCKEYQKVITERDFKISRLEKIIDKYEKLRVSAVNNISTTSNGNSTIIDIEPDLECQEAPVDIEIPPTELKGTFHFGQRVNSCLSGSCKAIAICPVAQIVMIAQFAPERNVFAQYGLRRYSTIDTNIKGFLPLHGKPITSIQLKPCSDTILTASTDKKVKLTSIVNNITVQTYNCDNEPTCVAWSTSRDQQFYVASGNCFVTLYDIRNTSEYIYQTPQRVAKTRVLSVAPISSGNLNGLIVNDMKGSQFLEVSEDSSYDSENIDRSLDHLKSHNLPLEGLMGSVDFDKKLNMALISTRKTPTNPNCTHNLLKLERSQLEDGTTSVGASPIKTFTGGATVEQPLMSQSRILRHPTLEDHVLVGASDQASRSVKLWDSSDNSVYQTIRTDRLTRDMVLYSPQNSNQHILYLMSETGFNVYRWDYA